MSSSIINIRTKGESYKGGSQKRKIGLCPACGSNDKVKLKGVLKIRKNSITGNYFLGCSRYPDCKCTYPFEGTQQEAAKIYKKNALYITRHRNNLS